jgi:hypothetical protein
MTESSQQMNSAEHRKSASLADLVDVRKSISLRESFPPSALIKTGVIALLFVGVNWRQFPQLVNIWQHDPNWTHGFVIPLFSLYLLYVRRDELFAARRRAFVWALPLVVLSIVFIVVSYQLIRTYWFCQLGMVCVVSRGFERYSRYLAADSVSYLRDADSSDPLFAYRRSASKFRGKVFRYYPSDFRCGYRYYRQSDVDHQHGGQSVRTDGRRGLQRCAVAYGVPGAGCCVGVPGEQGYLAEGGSSRFGCPGSYPLQCHSRDYYLFDVRFRQTGTGPGLHA